MPPQRKKAKTHTDPATEEHLPITDPALHPDLAAQSIQSLQGLSTQEPQLKMDPAMLHPDLAAQSIQSIQNSEIVPQQPQYLETALPTTQTISPRPKQRKNAAAASTAAVLAAPPLE